MLTWFTALLVTLVVAQEPPRAAAVFDQARPWTDYLGATDRQHELWVRNAGRAVSPVLVDRLKKAAPGLRLLVIAEAACSDSVNSIPYLGTLAAAAGVEMRVVDSVVGRPFMDAHHTPDGRGATPTVILIRDGREVAAWVERPTVLQTWILQAGSRLAPDERQERKLQWYEWSRGEDALAEIVALAEQTAGRGPAGGGQR